MCENTIEWQWRVIESSPEYVCGVEHDDFGGRIENGNDRSYD